MTTYYISSRGEINTKEAWEQYLTDFYTWLPSPQPKDSWEKAVRIFDLRPIEMRPGLEITNLKLVDNYTSAFDSSSGWGKL